MFKNAFKSLLRFKRKTASHTNVAYTAIRNLQRISTQCFCITESSNILCAKNQLCYFRGKHRWLFLRDTLVWASAYTMLHWKQIAALWIIVSIRENIIGSPLCIWCRIETTNTTCLNAIGSLNGARKWWKKYPHYVNQYWTFLYGNEELADQSITHIF